MHHRLLRDGAEEVLLDGMVVEREVLEAQKQCLRWMDPTIVRKGRIIADLRRRMEDARAPKKKAP